MIIDVNLKFEPLLKVLKKL